MIIKKTGVTGKVTAVLLAVVMLLAANCFAISAAADSLGTTLYVKTTQSSSPYIYYWVENGIDAGWPGKPMTSEGSDCYSFELPVDISELTGIIVNGSSSGNKLTGDVKNITGNFYDVEAGTWSMYDTSAIKISYYGSDNEDLYVGSKAVLSMQAKGGDGNLKYKISVNGKTLSDYSNKTSVLWEPIEPGDYTVKYEVKDGSGESNSKELTYTVKSTDGQEDPIFLGATPSNGKQIQKGSDVTVAVKGAGGQVNNKVLFYKTEIVDPNGKVVNTAYYKTGSKVTFTPSEKGEYTVNMYIQNNTVKNTTVSASYTYNSVDTVTDDSDSEVIVDSESDSEIVTDSDEPVSDSDVDTDSDTATDSDKPSNTDTDSEVDTDIPDTTRGDFDGNGKTELKDAYLIQKAVLAKATFTADQIKRADVNGDGRISLKDASLIQRHMAGIIVL